MRNDNDEFDSDDERDDNCEADLLSHLSKICLNNSDLESESREKKLSRSIFKIDMLKL